MTDTWDHFGNGTFQTFCILYPIYKKTTANTVNCKICKLKGCGKKSEPDPKVGGAKNLCKFHFTWYNGMSAFNEMAHYLQEKL